MRTDGTYLLDSDVFIAAKNLYYSFDICPGFWNSVVHHYRKGEVFSIDRICEELTAGNNTEELVKWVKNGIPKIFNSTKTDQVITAYREIVSWVQQNPQFSGITRLVLPRVVDKGLVLRRKRESRF